MGDDVHQALTAFSLQAKQLSLDRIYRIVRIKIHHRGHREIRFRLRQKKNVKTNHVYSVLTAFSVQS